MNIALILSGGTGSRLASVVPKQYIKVKGRLLISFALEAVLKSATIDAVYVVAALSWHNLISEEIKGLDTADKFKGFALPGENRQLSIYNGLLELEKHYDEKDIVFIHDAARPNLSEKIIESVIGAVEEHDGALPVLPMKDTVYYSRSGRNIDELLDRSSIYAGQAPEAFRLGRYLDANRRLLPEKILGINGSTEPAIMADMDIAMLPGDENNYKITTEADMERFMRDIDALE
ncbi:MAG: 2-C-methyl-D-erythritol 4-phosphate cytidylyltransferase [Lachnospiraceae bacterium]|nr:2-C-methyl-D-erythritol 4-phosphate cytidylyltransferase [Lachnospiraceae bacterium]